MNVKERAEIVFAEAQRLVNEDCRRMHAEHSAKGLLKSGGTLKRAVQIFTRRTEEALKQVLSEVANVIDHRGRAWNRAMGEISNELETMIVKAPALLESSIRIAAAGSVSAQNAVHNLINESANGLRNHLAAFRNGYTAPRSRKWSERHPVFYAIIMMVTGAVISQFFGKVFEFYISS